MHPLLRNWKILLMLALLITSFLLLTFNGLQYGVDFEGGTLFQLHLAEPVSSPQEMSIITSVIDKRLDFAGLKDTSVRSFGDEFVIAQIAESDPEEIQRLERLLLRQGKFEATLHGELLFTGSDIISISRDAAQGYGVQPVSTGIHQWFLPFTLKETAARNFTEQAFHQCTLVSLDGSGGKVYDCENTYFFVDRPVDAVILLPQEAYDLDASALLLGASFSLPDGLLITELIENAQLPVVVVNDSLTDSQSSDLAGYVLEKRVALVHPELDEETRDTLSALGFTLQEIPLPEEVPWLWRVTGARQVIALNPDIANLDPYVESVEQAIIFSHLQVRGVADSGETAYAELNNLTILLESGSLPIPIDDVSRESISPFLGQEFLTNAIWMGILAIIIVGAVVFIRYRVPKMVVPILLITFAEIYILLGLLALIQLKLDLAAVAGIIAAVGTGVDHQIIIADELLRKEQAAISSLTGKVKKAFFIITAAAATTIATMLPIIFLGLGSGKLVGFAITIILGVLVGILITRPAFGEIARHILE